MCTYITSVYVSQFVYLMSLPWRADVYQSEAKCKLPTLAKSFQEPYNKDGWMTTHGERWLMTS